MELVAWWVAHLDQASGWMSMYLGVLKLGTQVSGQNSVNEYLASLSVHSLVPNLPYREQVELRQMA